MTEDGNDNNADRALFASLVMMLSTSAMQQLGRLPNPVTGKTETDLEGAQMGIDMLDMLKRKTHGNLDGEETKMVSDLLASLQMAYVQSSKAAPKPEPDGGAESAETDAAPGGKGAGTGKPDAGRQKPPDRDPKFHKSYG